MDRPAGMPGPERMRGTLERRLVDEDAVLLLSVLAEHFPVIADGGHDAAAGARRQLREQAPDLAIHVCHLAGIPLVARPVLPVAGRLVGRVRIVVVDPQKIGPVARGPGRPCQRGVGDRFGAALRVSLLPHPLGDHRVVVQREAPAEAEAAIEHPRRHERGRVVSVTGEDGRQRRDVGGKRRNAIVAHAVLGRVQPGHEAAVRWQGQRSRRERAGETRAGAGEGVEVGGEGLAGDDSAHVVGASRVEGQQDEGRRLVGGDGHRG